LKRQQDFVELNQMPLLAVHHFRRFVFRILCKFFARSVLPDANLFMKSLSKRQQNCAELNQKLFPSVRHCSRSLFHNVSKFFAHSPFLRAALFLKSFLKVPHGFLGWSLAFSLDVDA
jgi:hypothetical protein